MAEVTKQEMRKYIGERYADADGDPLKGDALEDKILRVAYGRVRALDKDIKKTALLKAHVSEGKALPASFEGKRRYVPRFAKAKFDADGTPKEIATWAHAAPENGRPKPEPKPRKPKAVKPEPKAKPAPKVKAAKPAPKVKPTGTAAKLAKAPTIRKAARTEPEVRGEARPPVAVADTGGGDLKGSPIREATQEEMVAWVKANPGSKVSAVIRQFKVSFNRATEVVAKAKE